MSRRCVFLDRDGVINIDNGYVSKWEDFQFIPGALNTIRKIYAMGYDLVIVTNQSGIVRGYYTIEEYRVFTSRMLAAIESNGVRVLADYFCPHLPEGAVFQYSKECNCRKPAPGMILRAAMEYDINLAHSIMVGDKISDMDAATAAGVRHRYLVSDKYEDTDACPNQRYDGMYSSLAQFVNEKLNFGLERCN
jgi:D-glycero-D-manno-heptose 1,7-bisphosphate phosphatase